MMIFDPKDWGINPDVEVGNDGFAYGNYVDWDSFRRENEEELLDYFGVDLPWGNSLSFQEYIDVISQDIFQKTDLSQKYLVDNVLIKEASEWLYYVSIEFISRKSEVSDDLVSAIFDYYGVPSGTQYEYDLPEHLRYWQDDLSEFEYDNYKKYPIEVEEYEDKINDIFNKIDVLTDETVKLSLILSSLIITESMYKSLIVNKIPQENHISEFSKDILQNEVNKMLRGNNDVRNKLFKKLYHEKAPRQNWTDLRNSLAHDIAKSEIKEDIILYLNLKTGGKREYSISKLKLDLLEFSKTLKMIVSK